MIREAISHYRVLEKLGGGTAGVQTIGPILLTRDLKTCVYGYHRTLADLYLVEDLQ